MSTAQEKYPETSHDYNRKLEITGFPDQLRRRFKAAAALTGKNMSEVLIMLADEWTQQQEQQQERGKADAR
jgi:hypothetical protein